jgi:C1A family cysteine protease
VITSIKDQGKCGACWTFATNAYGESRMLLKNLTTNPDINLSEQFLLKCTPQCDCDGGYL